MIKDWRFPLQKRITHIKVEITMKENNSPLENLKDEYKMFLLRNRIRQNKWIKRLCNKILSVK